MNYLVPSFLRPCSDSKEVVMKHKATLNPNDNLDQKLKQENIKREKKYSKNLFFKDIHTSPLIDPFTH